MLRGFRWQLLAFLAALLLAAGLLTRSLDDVRAAPAAAQTTSVPTYTEALIGQVQRLNPLFASLNPVDQDITTLIFEGLTRINEYGEPLPGLAQSWQISTDGLEYVVRLRQDVLWQDGMPFTSADVAYTMSILRSPDFPGDLALGEFWRTVETYALDEYTVRFRLTQPLGAFLDALRIGILPEHALRGTTAARLAAHPFNLSPIGTGPYQLEALRGDAAGTIRRVDLRVAPVYRQRPEGATGYALERVSFRLYDDFAAALAALQTGAVNGLAARNRSERTPLNQLAGTGAVTLRNAIEPTVGMLIFNWTRDDTRFFRELEVRQALQMGINRASIIERNLSGQAVVADSPLLLNSWAYTADLPRVIYDPNRARDLLAAVELPAREATATEDPAPTAEAAPSTAAAGGIAFRILTPDEPTLIAVAQEMANQWALPGVSVTVEAVDLTTYRERLENHEFQAALVELTRTGSADPDVYAFWHQGQYPDGKNYGGADDRVISELLEQARSNPYGINRINLYQTFQRVFVDRAIALPLYYPLFTVAFSPQVQGVHFGFIGSPADRFLTIQNWSLAQ